MSYRSSVERPFPTSFTESAFGLYRSMHVQFESKVEATHRLCSGGPDCPGHPKMTIPTRPFPARASVPVSPQTDDSVVQPANVNHSAGVVEINRRPDGRIMLDIHHLDLPRCGFENLLTLLASNPRCTASGCQMSKTLPRRIPFRSYDLMVPVPSFSVPAREREQLRSYGV
jgi:hypothetical protein